MKTTEQWLANVKSSTSKLNHWLSRQFVGETLAAERIKALAEASSGTNKKLLTKIASDEASHAGWVKDLLTARGLPIPEVSIKGTRYWKPILKNLRTFEELTAAGHHAELMRLVRITALANDEEVASDIRDVFKRILPDEQFHAKAFKHMSNAEAISKTQEFHQKGLQALGLAM